VDGWAGIIERGTTLAKRLSSNSFINGKLFFTTFAILLILIPACGHGSPGNNPANPIPDPTPEPYVLPEKESTVFNGVPLTPIAEQGNNAIEGTQIIDRNEYRLTVTGLVENELSMTYDELLTLPAHEETAYMPCVEGWGFMAKWTGFKVADVLDKAVIQSAGMYVMFHCSDGYSTGLPMEYLRTNNILMAFGLNDVTLPPDRGFPFQLVAKSKYGYKWAKWITKIEVLDAESRGYWESYGYSNNADEDGPKFDF
jgi:DMSO/TMAO reductase YedYZ molybdopterin-dependent catalytic subunit